MFCESVIKGSVFLQRNKVRNEGVGLVLVRDLANVGWGD